VKKEVVKAPKAKTKKEFTIEPEPPAIDEEKLFNTFQTGIYSLFDSTYKGTKLHNNCAPLYAASVNMFGYIYQAIAKHRRKSLLDSFNKDIKTTYVL
jgi:hypothetical protein